MGGIHDDEPLLLGGKPVEAAAAAAILVHGRGASPEDILSTLAPVLDIDGFAFMAPGAAGSAWYPQPFTAPVESNEPWLSSALGRIDQLVRMAEEHVAVERVMLLGFSQGACLALEYAARHPRRYGALVGLSGALIGPPGMPREDRGSLDGTPVLLASSDPDPYIPPRLVRDAGQTLAAMGGDVKVRIYPGMGHTVNASEIADVRELMAALVRREEVTR